MRLTMGSAAIAVALAVPPAVQGAAPTSPSGSIEAAVDAIAQAALAEGPVAGMTIGVARDGKPVLVKGYGLANLEHRSPATADTVYRIRSESKTFAAVAVLQLVEQGKLELEDELSRLLPDVVSAAQGVRVRNLLSHTSGVPNYGGPSWRSRKGLDLSPLEWIALVKDQPRQFAPGTDFAYSNPGFDLLALIVEKASGESYPDYLHRHIAEPLGLAHTGYCTNRSVVPGRAAPYEVAEHALVNADAWGNYGYGCGMMCSTVPDLLAWEAALDTHRILAAASVEKMRTPTRLVDGPAIDYGFGARLGDLEGHRQVGHGGSGGGWTARLSHYPDDHLTISVLMNTENDDDPSFPSAGVVEERVARRLLGLPPLEVKDLPLAPAEGALYVGEWELQGDRSEIFTEGGVLKVRTAAPRAGTFALRYQGNHTFVPEVAPQVRVRFVVEGGQARWARQYTDGFFVGLLRRAGPAPAH